MQFDFTSHLPTIDVNECLENLSICGSNECENSYGTYTCIEPRKTQPTSTTTTTTTEVSQTVEENDDDENIPDVGKVENNRIPKGEDEEEGERSGESETEIEKADQREDIDNSIEKQEKEVDEIETDSTPGLVIPTPETTKEPSTTEMSNTILGQIESENESGEDSNEDEQHSDVEEEHEKHPQIHHQSSTVTSNVGSKCDNGLRLDSNGKCVGE